MRVSQRANQATLEGADARRLAGLVDRHKADAAPGRSGASAGGGMPGSGGGGAPGGGGASGGFGSGPMDSAAAMAWKMAFNDPMMNEVHTRRLFLALRHALVSGSVSASISCLFMRTYMSVADKRGGG